MNRERRSCRPLAWNYLFKRVQGDNRPHLKVRIYDVEFCSLLDSGASQSIVGARGWEILKRLVGVRLIPVENVRVTVANGKTCEPLGRVDLPICLEGRVRVIKCLVVPEVRMSLVLGIDFWRAMEISPNFKTNEWDFQSCEVVASAVRERLDDEQQRRLDELLERSFNKMGTGLGCAKNVEHILDTGDAMPIKQRYYPVSPYLQNIMNQELDKMLELGVVEPSRSAWSSPVVLIKKKNNKDYRFCIDFRAVNKVTKRDAYALPYISTILDRLRNARYLSSIDLKSAYWQIPLAQDSKEKTAFTVPGRGLFQFTRMPFGLHNAPATWQRFVDNTLGHDLEPHVFIYLDDIVVATPDFDLHLEVLRKIFERLIAAGLTINREKCEMVKVELRYLGYIVDQYGLRVDPEKVSAVMNFPVPTTVKAVRRFVGLVSWYRRFVPGFSAKVVPLTHLTKKRTKFKWSEDAERAFLELKECLVSAPILTCPDFTRKFIIQTDASQKALGAVLVQQFDEGEKVIAYASRTLSSAETRYSATELECLAVIWAVKKFRCYVEGTRFEVVTDHASLRWLANLKDPAGRLGRWALQLQAYDFDLVHRKGKYHQVPDALSRAVIGADLIKIEEKDQDEWYKQLRQKVERSPEQYPSWKVEEGQIFKYISSDQPQFEENYHWKLVVPRSLRAEVLRECHDEALAGHLGIFKTRKRVAQSYYWPKMTEFITRYVRRCEICQAQKPDQRGPAGKMSVRKVQRPWQVVSTDLMGPFPRSSRRNRFLLVVVDVFTKFSLLFPIPTATAQAIKRHLEEDIFLIYGVPDYLVCDNGRQYVSKSFRSMVASYGCKLQLTPLYHPQSNPTERTNRVIKTMIRSFIGESQKEWDAKIAKLGFALRTAVHEVTGYTPAYLNFGRELVVQGAGCETAESSGEANVEGWATYLRELQGLREKVVKRMKEVSQRGADRYNLRRRPVAYQVGQTVWKRNFVLSSAADQFAAKLAPKFVKCRIIKKLSNNVYEVVSFENGKRLGRYHVNDLKLHPVDPEEE